MKYGIMVRNTGMWGITTWCKREDGMIEAYPTKEEAQKVATERNDRNCINSHNYYFVEELKED